MRTPLLLLLTTLACGPERRLVRETRREHASLSDRAELYWRAVRWGDVAAAAACVPAEERPAFESWLTSWQADERTTDFTLLDVTVGAKMDPPRGGREREAVVTLRTEGYRADDQVLRSETITQRWYQDGHGWYVEWP